MEFSAPFCLGLAPGLDALFTHPKDVNGRDKAGLDGARKRPRFVRENDG
jgi:hypothetical protein